MVSSSPLFRCLRPVVTRLGDHWHARIGLRILTLALGRTLALNVTLTLALDLTLTLNLNLNLTLSLTQTLRLTLNSTLY